MASKVRRLSLSSCSSPDGSFRSSPLSLRSCCSSIPKREAQKDEEGLRGRPSRTRASTGAALRKAARRCTSPMTCARFLNLPHELGERVAYTFGGGQRLDEA